MRNIDIIANCVVIMKSHNYTCSEIFYNIKLDRESEQIFFEVKFHFLDTAFQICELLNLTLHQIDETTYKIN